MAEQEGIESGKDYSFEPQGLTGRTLEEQIEQERAESAAGEAGGEATQEVPAEIKPTTPPAAEPVVPVRVTIDSQGNVLPGAVFTGDFASDPSDLQPDKQ